MAANTMKRKLTTIFCADVQSYSTLMAVDEAETLARLRRYRAIMSELFERHDGRKVNTWGDAVIAEFASVVEAVRCAIEIQEAIGAENRDLPEARQMWFRIGINLGDVMQDGGDLYGDGVNVAARLEALADPGGIMVSETVFNLTNRHLSVGYEFAGERKVKGQEEPVAGYRVRMPRPGGAEESAGTDQDDRRSEPTARKPPAAVETASSRLGRFRSWFAYQPTAVRASVFMIAMFAMINLLTNGFSHVWFVYPSIPFAFFLVVRGLGGRSASRRSE